ncbi:hypothetical protein FSC37_16655 [Piscinibacter aquaticus]|uniref:Uncharacterized protein n=1 Tax=Piscinibacter aquaticus TaxID=392597 RepID=A0A5C6U237_9BURK|nr:hypothetical protein FSC37_16655 [Piscinibacter aquaticus]
MRHVTLGALLAACCALAGCAGSSPFAPTPTAAAGTPYAGLSEASYGPRSTSQFRACEPDSGNRLAALKAAAVRPAHGLMKIDSTLQSLDLAGAFTDPLGTDHPAVAVLSHGPDGIVFWHRVPEVPLGEVASAAKTGAPERSAARCTAARPAIARHRGAASPAPRSWSPTRSRPTPAPGALESRRPTPIIGLLALVGHEC